ncbi:MAG: ferredoxin family protein [Planctomycetota bacterium]
MPPRLSVIISQGQSQNPAKRQLEEELVVHLLGEPGIDVTVVPHLYDLRPDDTAQLALSGIHGHLVVLSWLYERAARWVLDRNGIQGQAGTSLLVTEPPEDDEEEEQAPAEDETPRVLDEREIPRRKIYCIELGAVEAATEFVTEVKRIAAELATPVVQLGDWVQGSPDPAALQRFQQPTNDTALGGAPPAETNGKSVHGVSNGMPAAEVPHEPIRFGETPDRRWYPVIDFSRCTNCMECIDFCLFGVYGVDAAETILVEQPDNCRKGCPACSRVCPENAIIFPQHKTPGIAGAPMETGGLKIDLSRLFGAPDAVDLAAKERDEQLLLAGREAVGPSVGVPKRRADQAEQPRDDLDELLDGLDDFE